MRGAAQPGQNSGSSRQISTHAPHARRGEIREAEIETAIISTHAPHARRGATTAAEQANTAISTHAPHARRGKEVAEMEKQEINFYSRASCEARRTPSVR